MNAVRKVSSLRSIWTGKRSRRGSAKTALVWLAAWIIVCVAGGTSVAAQTAPTYSWCWFFYEKDLNSLYSTVAYRPFYVKTTHGDKSAFEASLMPVVYWKYTRERMTEWKSLFGLVDSLDYIHTDGVEDYDFAAFPLVFYGDSPDPKDRYFMIMPFGGTVRGKLGQDRISAYVFPGVALFFVLPPSNIYIALAYLAASFVPAYVDYESREYHAKGIFWPLMQWGQSPDRKDIRILPLYAHNYRKDRYDNYSFLLLANFQNVSVGRDEQKTAFILPFYGRRWNTSGNSNASTLFWPLFSWGYNKKMGDFELNFPWPLVMIQDSVSPYIHKRIFFPVYGNYVNNNQQTFFITPLYFTLKKKAENFVSEYYINALIVWYFKRDYKKSADPVYGSSWRYFKLWPLFHYEHDTRGNVSFNFLSLLPFRDPEGYEMLYQPFWTLFEYKKFSSGEKRLGILLRTYYQNWGDDFLRIKIPFLFSYGRSNNVLTELSFLCSLFGYYRDASGERLRVFWIPVKLAEGAPGLAGGGDSPETMEDGACEDAVLRNALRYGSRCVIGDGIGMRNNDYMHYSMMAF